MSLEVFDKLSKMSGEAPSDCRREERIRNIGGKNGKMIAVVKTSSHSDEVKAVLS